MNPSNEMPGMELPPPLAEPSAGAENRPERTPSTPEVAPAAGRKAGPTQAAAPPPVIPMPAPPAAPTSGGAATTTIAVADDSDLIEKEWVNKAKAIVERTRNDPYRQSEELTGVKIDYMQKRYNKTIKSGK